MPDDGKRNKPRELVADLRVFDRYYLKRTLGHGGMGTVWLAHDRTLEQPVALKFLADHLFQNHHEIERLKQETRRNLKLSHPNIVRIHDFERDAHGAAIAMEYVDGWSLWTMRIDKPQQIFEAAEIAPWIKQLCDALDYAHNEAHIVHRDLKPANLLINSRGQLKVTDFGLSRELRGKPTSGPVPKIVGTDWYMGPQQWTGDPPAVADDIYSLGATIYELLTGKPPFYEGDILKQVFENVPPTMTERLHELGIQNVTVPLAWEETVGMCLAKEPDRRPVSVKEVAIRLGLIEGPKPEPRLAPVTGPASEEVEHSPEAPEHAVIEEGGEAPSEPTPAARLYSSIVGSRPKLVAALAAAVVLLSIVAFFSVRRIVINHRLGAAAPSAPLLPGQPWRNSLGMRFVTVPGTSVMMSIWETRVQDFEAFAREVNFDAGNGLLQLNANGQWRPTEHSWRDPEFAQTTNSPVIGVTWHDAEEFCAWLTARERKKGILKSNQIYRLPRMAEWIYAAGTTIYPWGDDWPPPIGAGNFAGEELHQVLTNHVVITGYRDVFPFTAPVGSFKANALGLHDLAGNVWEFCADGPPDAAKTRWMMGGSWENETKDSLATSFRGRGDSARRYAHRGFRCVLAWTNEAPK